MFNIAVEEGWWDIIHELKFEYDLNGSDCVKLMIDGLLRPTTHASIKRLLYVISAKSKGDVCYSSKKDKSFTPAGCNCQQFVSKDIMPSLDKLNVGTKKTLSFSEDYS